jgi:hypothetical protein
VKVPGAIVTDCVLLAACSSGGSNTHTGGGTRTTTSAGTGTHTSTSTGGHTGTSGGGGAGAKSPACKTAYKTADELAAKITAVGMGCADYKANSGDAAVSIDIDGVPKAESSGICTVGGEPGSAISVCKDAGALAKADSAIKLAGSARA